MVAGVLAMFIFVVADPLMSWLQSSGGGGQRSAGTVVATWEGGSLNVQQLNYLAQRRLKISEFLRGLYIKAATSVEQEGGTPLPPTLPNFIIENNNFAAVQANCVSTRVLAELAKKSSLSVSDDVVNHYLREWGLRRTDDAEISTLLDRVGLKDKTLFAGLRELLLGNFYMSSYSLAMGGVMPEERWQDWKRINERIAVEAAILPAEKFLADVPEPDETQLKAFYELHKDRIDGLYQAVMNTRLPSPDPGFREPRQVRLQYLLGSVDDWTHKLLDTVTESEIADYYERNKRTQFVKTSTSTSAAGLFDDEEEESPDDKTTTDEAPDDASNEKTTDEEAMEDESADAQPSEESEDSAEPAAETPATESVEPATESVEAPAENESSHLPRQSPFRLAALQTEAEEEEEEAGEETTAEEQADETEAPLNFEPLENVSDQIRRSLARDKAVVALQKVISRTYASLQSAYNPYGFEVVSARTEEKEIPAPPSKLSDYKSIATKTGLASEETVLLSELALSETFVGRAFDAQSRSQFVRQGMFGDQELYEPYHAIDLDGNSYIVCKVEDIASRVPEFDEVRDMVLAAWKKQEAAKLALAKAEELAKQAETSGDTVATVARAQSYNVVTTDMFSWLTFGTTQAELRRGPRLGEAPPLESVGVEFMTKAFELEPDQKIALLNHDHSYAYVVQLDRREQTKSEMQQRFLVEANNWYGGRVMNSVRAGASQRQLLGQLSEQAGLNLDKLEEFLIKDSQ